MIKDSKTYTVAGKQLTDEKIDKDYKGKMDIIKKGIEDALREVKRISNEKHHGKVDISINTGKGRYLRIVRNEAGKLEYHAKDKGKDVPLTRNDIIQIYKQRETLIIRAENYKEDPVRAREEAKRAAASFMSKGLTQRVAEARVKSAFDNKSLIARSDKDVFIR